MIARPKVTFGHGEDDIPPLTPSQRRIVLSLYRAELERDISAHVAAAYQRARTREQLKRLLRQRGQDRRHAIANNMPTPNRIIWRRIIVRVVGFWSRETENSERIWNGPWDDRTHRLRAQGIEKYEEAIDFGMRPVAVFADGRNDEGDE